MSKFSLAASLADEIGTSIGKATRFIDEVGAPAARETLEEATSAAGRTVSKWWKPTAAGGGLVGGGALAWRQQHVEQARAIADQKQSYSSAVQSIMDSDLPPEQKRQLIRELNQNGGGGGGGGGGNNNNNGGGNSLFGGDLQTTIILLVVMAFAFRYTLGSDQ